MLHGGVDDPSLSPPRMDDDLQGAREVPAASGEH